MSRSGYSDCIDGWNLIRWRGAVKSAMSGKRGQAFLREMLAALDAMPHKVLVRNELVTARGHVCAMGAVCVARGLDVSGVDEEDRFQVGELMGIAPAMVAEIAFENDDDFWGDTESAEHRWTRMRLWVAGQINA